MKEIRNFEDFLYDLREAGMSMGGENSEGIFTLCDLFAEPVVWHTEEKETDPWEWRIRVLDECSDIAYGKFFFRKSGYITREWYPYFYRVRRSGSLKEAWEDGKISVFAKRIYELLSEYKELPLHLLKEYGGFTKKDKSGFDRAITELQMKFYITMCGKKRKVSRKGEEYGWSSTVFCLTEDFFDKEAVDAAEKLDYDRAYDAIERQIYRLNPEAEEKKARKFIVGQ